MTTATALATAALSSRVDNQVTALDPEQGEEPRNHVRVERVKRGGYREKRDVAARDVPEAALPRPPRRPPSAESAP